MRLHPRARVRRIVRELSDDVALLCRHRSGWVRSAREADFLVISVGLHLNGYAYDETLKAHGYDTRRVPASCELLALTCLA